MSSTSSLRDPPPCSSWEGVVGEGEEEEGAGHSHTLLHGVSVAQHISQPVLGTGPACQAETITQAIGESLPEIDGTCHVQRAISNYTALLNTSSKMQGL